MHWRFGRGTAAGWAVTLLLGCIAARGLFAARIVAGHDALIYVLRLVEFDDSVRAGILLPRWAPHLGAGHGEPVWVFVPPLMQALSEVFHLLGAPLFLAENLGLLLLFLFAGATMHVLGSRIGGTAGAIAASASWFFAPYVLVDLYVRQSASEFAAACFLPLIVLGFHRLAAGEERGSAAMIAGGIAAVGFSHNAVLLIAFPICVLAAIALVPRSLSALIGVVAGLGMATWSWLPALIERQYARLDLLRKGYFTYGNHFATPMQIVYSPWGFGYSQPGPHDPLSFSIGPLLIAISIVALIAARRARGTWVFAAVASIGIVLSTAVSSPLWAAFPLLQHLAFPWRFLILPSIAIPALAAFAARRLPLVTGVLLLGHLVMYVPHARPQKYLDVTERDYAPQRIAMMGMLDTSLDEYRPRWVEDFVPFSPDAFDPPLPGRTIEYTPVRRRFDVVNAAPRAVRLQIFYFPGWGVQIDGQPVPVRPARHSGLIEFMLPAGRHDVDARFSATPVRAASAVLTLIALAAAVLFRSGARRRGSPARPR